MYDTKKTDSNYQSIFNQRGDTYHQAMISFPKARDQEFEEILRLANPQPSQVICDAPSGGGYLQRYLPNHKIIAIETSEAFYNHCITKNWYRAILSPLNKIDLPDSTADCFISLAGLHHLLERPAFFKEAYRILRPGGTCCVADVMDGSPPAKFLNIFVDSMNSMGHKGNFFTQDIFAEITSAGFKITNSYYKTYHWVFANTEDMCRYTTLLFGLDLASPTTVLEGIGDYLGYDIDEGRCRMNWGLLFIKGVK